MTTPDAATQLHISFMLIIHLQYFIFQNVLIKMEWINQYTKNDINSYVTKSLATKSLKVQK